MDDADADQTEPEVTVTVATTSEREVAADSAAGRARAPKLTAARYSLAAELGHGGMGEVLLARDEQIGREVAVKRMRAQDPTPRQVHRFMREACIQGRLEHPAIVPVHELGRDVDGRPFFAMKKLAGTTLAQILAEPDAVKFPRQRLLRAFAEVCLAIELAHTRGVVHRDLKPENIMLGDFGEVYVLDWGVAKLLGDAAEDIGEEPPGVDTDEAVVTAVGAAIGTPGYMSPEQVRGEADVGPRSDVYALGSVLFEVLAGAPLHPRGHAALMSTVHGAVSSPLARAPDRDVPPELDALCRAATQIAPASARPTARELGAGVERFLDGNRDLAQRRELARAHLDAATAAFAAGAGGMAERATAMREAGRALALDPLLAGAAELVTRLMLEPPRETPPDVEQAIRVEGVSARRANTRIARWAYLAYLMLLPELAWAGRWLDFAVLAACIVVAGGLTATAARLPRTPPLIVFALANAALIMCVSHFFTPVLLAPGLAAVTGLILALNPPDGRFVGPLSLIGLMLLAALAPWLLEAFGVLAPTLTLDTTGVHLFGAAVVGDGRLTTVITVATLSATVVMSVMIGFGIRRSERSQRLRLHLQAWQLRQLVA